MQLPLQLLLLEETTILYLQSNNAAGATITANKTGTLNTKSVTASQLATNSPLLPHKMNGQLHQPPAPMPGNALKAGGINRNNKGPPDLPPRGIARGNSIGSGPPSRDASLNRRMPPDVPPKRSSLTRSDLALFADMVIILE